MSLIKNYSFITLLSSVHQNEVNFFPRPDKAARMTKQKKANMKKQENPGA